MFASLALGPTYMFSFAHPVAINWRRAQKTCALHASVDGTKLTLPKARHEARFWSIADRIIGAFVGLLLHALSQVLGVSPVLLL